MYIKGYETCEVLRYDATDAGLEDIKYFARNFVRPHYATYEEFWNNVSIVKVRVRYNVDLRRVIDLKGN